MKIGDSVGTWIVIDKGDGKWVGNGKGKNKIFKRTWICRCNCGFCNMVERDVVEKNLMAGQSNGCGLKSRSKNGKNNKKFNKYNLTGEYGIGYLHDSYEFYFDKEDYEKIRYYSWCLLSIKDKYIMTTEKDDAGKYNKIFLHNLIMNNINKEIVVDHIYGELFDNRKERLREITKINNMKNLKKYKTNTSGTKGVSFNKNENKWCAYIGCEKEKYNLGKFLNIKDAIKARKEAEIKYFGEFNRQEEHQ